MIFLSQYKTEDEIFKVKEGNLFAFPVGMRNDPFAPRFLRKNFPPVYMTYQQYCHSPNEGYLEFMTMDMGQDFVISLILVVDNDKIDTGLWFKHLEKMIKVKDPSNVYFHANWLKLPNFSMELFENEFEEWAKPLLYETKVHFIWQPETEIVLPESN